MLCWICQKRKANSGEHKFKASLLKQMHGRTFNQEISYVHDGKVLRLEGPNNKKVKFPQIICTYCNNTFTASHDKSFDQLINWSNKNYQILSDTKKMDFQEVYGDEWLESKMNLLKYMAKHAGCKISTSQMENDVSNLSNLIIEGKLTDSFQIKFMVKEGFAYIDMALQYLSSSRLKFSSNSSTIFRKTGNNVTVYFGGITTYNWLSIIWVHSQNQYTTHFDGFSNQNEELIFLPFSDLPEIDKNNYWIEYVDNQGTETLDDLMKLFDSFIN